MPLLLAAVTLDTLGRDAVAAAPEAAATGEGLTAGGDAGAVRVAATATAGLAALTAVGAAACWLLLPVVLLLASLGACAMGAGLLRLPRVSIGPAAVERNMKTAAPRASACAQEIPRGTHSPCLIVPNACLLSVGAFAPARSSLCVKQGRRTVSLRAYLLLCEGCCHCG